MQNRQLEAWLQHACQGDREAMSQLYTHTQLAVHSYALSLLRHVEDARDVTQKTYLKLYGARYTPQGKPMAWLLTITKNLCLTAWQRRSDEPLDEQLADAAPDLQQWVGDRQLLATALTTLNEQERQIVLLTCIGGVKNREIAALLQLPLSTVLSKNRRALAKLRAQLEEV